MIHTTLWSAATHAGITPLCLCCCDHDVDEPAQDDGEGAQQYKSGGAGFKDEARITGRVNPLVQVARGTADTISVDGVTVHSHGPEIRGRSNRHSQHLSEHRPVTVGVLADPEVHSIDDALLGVDDYMDLLGLIALAESDDTH